MKLRLLTSIALVSMLGAALTGCDTVAGIAGETLNPSASPSASTGTTDNSGETVDKKAAMMGLVPSGESFFMNADKQAGSYQGPGDTSVLVTVAGSQGKMYVVNTSSEATYAVHGSDGKALMFATETLGGQPFVPVYVEKVGPTNIQFAHRTKAGECNFYSADKDGDMFNANLRSTDACSY